MPRLQVNSHTPVLDCSARMRGWDIQGVLDAYQAEGMPLEKLVLGLATYGRAFRFRGGRHGEARPGVGRARDPDRTPALQGACTEGNYTMAWYEIKLQALAEGTTVSIDPTQMAAYCLMERGKYWMGFDTPETHRMKMCYARSRGISGVMVWDADTDDSMELVASISNSTSDPCEGYAAPCCDGDPWIPTWLAQ